jgi:hypothetical protein
MPPTFDHAAESDLSWKPDTFTIPPARIQKPQVLPYYYRPLFTLNPSAPEVPEPGTLVLFGTGLAGILIYRFARKNK